MNPAKGAYTIDFSWYYYPTKWDVGDPQYVGASAFPEVNIAEFLVEAGIVRLSSPAGCEVAPGVLGHWYDGKGDYDFDFVNKTGYWIETADDVGVTGGAFTLVTGVAFSAGCNVSDPGAPILRVEVPLNLPLAGDYILIPVFAVTAEEQLTDSYYADNPYVEVGVYLVREPGTLVTLATISDFDSIPSANGSELPASKTEDTIVFAQPFAVSGGSDATLRIDVTVTDPDGEPVAALLVLSKIVIIPAEGVTTWCSIDGDMPLWPWAKITNTKAGPQVETTALIQAAPAQNVYDAPQSYRVDDVSVAVSWYEAASGWFMRVAQGGAVYELEAVPQYFEAGYSATLHAGAALTSEDPDALDYASATISTLGTDPILDLAPPYLGVEAQYGCSDLNASNNPVVYAAVEVSVPDNGGPGILVLPVEWWFDYVPINPSGRVFVFHDLAPFSEARAEELAGLVRSGSAAGAVRVLEAASGADVLVFEGLGPGTHTFYFVLSPPDSEGSLWIPIPDPFLPVPGDGFTVCDPFWEAKGVLRLGAVVLLDAAEYGYGYMVIGDGGAPLDRLGIVVNGMPSDNPEELPPKFILYWYDGDVMAASWTVPLNKASVGYYYLSADQLWTGDFWSSWLFESRDWYLMAFNVECKTGYTPPGDNNNAP